MKGAVISSADENQSVENEYKKNYAWIYPEHRGCIFIIRHKPITFTVEDMFDWSDNAPSVIAVLNIN